MADGLTRRLCLPTFAGRSFRLVDGASSHTNGGYKKSRAKRVSTLHRNNGSAR
jgi:hypothetical protein